jgi:hypothetical protein
MDRRSNSGRNGQATRAVALHFKTEPELLLARATLPVLTVSPNNPEKTKFLINCLGRRVDELREQSWRQAEKHGSQTKWLPTIVVTTTVLSRPIGEKNFSFR